MLSKRRFIGIASASLVLGIGLWMSLYFTAAPTARPGDMPNARIDQVAPHTIVSPRPLAQAADLTGSVRRLIDAANQGDAQSAYQASVLLEQCWIVDFMAGPSTDRTENAEVSATQTDFTRQQSALRAQCKNIPAAIRADRFRLVHIAAQAHIPGAANAFARIGPPAGVDALQTQPDDPGVSTWKQEAENFLKEAASSGDLESMNALSSSYQMGLYTQRDPLAALTYAYAYARRQQMLNDSPISPGYARLLDTLSRGLSAEQQRLAQERGSTIAAASPLPRP